MFSPELLACSRFDWCNPKISDNPHVKCFVDAVWWQRSEEVVEAINLQLRKATLATLDSEALFCFSLSMYAVGNVAEGNVFSAELHKRRGASLFCDWLEVEVLGRSAEYSNQAILVKKLLKGKNQFPDWLATACLQSLNNSVADTSRLLVVIEKTAFNTLLSKVLYARLLAGQFFFTQSRDVLNEILAANEKYAPALWYKGLLEWQLGDHKESDRLFTRSIECNLIDRANLVLWLTQSLSSQYKNSAFHPKLELAYRYVHQSSRQVAEVASYDLIWSWIGGLLDRAKLILEKIGDVQRFPIAKTDRNAFVFYKYIYKLCSQIKENINNYKCTGGENGLSVVGESHSLSPCHARFIWANGQYVIAKSCFVVGVKMHHLAQSENSYKDHVKGYVDSLSLDSNILFTIGEIDCRPDEGLIQACTSKNIDMKVLIEKTINGYIGFLSEILAGRASDKITVQGIPAPNYEIKARLPEGVSVESFLAMFAQVNNHLKDAALAKGYGFLDVYAATVSSCGLSNKKWHIDDYHLAPNFYASALQYVVRPVLTSGTISGDSSIVINNDESDRVQYDLVADKYHRIGVEFYKAGDVLNCRENLRKAMQLDPGNFMYVRDFASIQCVLGDYKETEQLLEAVLMNNPSDQLGLQSLAVALSDQGKLAEALDVHRQLLMLGSNNTPAMLNAAFAHLKAGHWETGWALYESRYHPNLQDKLAILPHGLNTPLWSGQGLQGVKVIVVGEQGLGDQIMFARYIPLLRQRGVKKIGLMVSTPLKDAFEISGLADDVFDNAGDINENYDCAMFIGSLPFVLSETDPANSWIAPFLRPRKINKRSIEAVSGRLNIGLVWSGNVTNRDARFVAKYRFFSPKEFQPLFETDTLACYSLQYGEAESQLEVQGVPRLGRVINSIQDAVDLISDLDAVVTADTVYAHVAGAMGKPVHILLPFASDWRWGLESKFSKWYPTAHLYRSKNIGDWKKLVNDVRDALVA